MVMPPRLRAGDTIAIVSPSSGAAGRYPHRVERGIAALETLGYRVRLAPHALNQLSYVSDTAEHRAADLEAMFADPEVRAIVAAIGGDHSCHLLPLLDWELIARNPKILVGYSDITVLNVASWQRTGLVTFNGPTLLPDWAEYPGPFAYTRDLFLRAVCRAEALGALEPATHWTEELLSWQEKRDLERPRAMEPSPGWTWLRDGVGEGVLVGGCIESLQHLRGTPYWPDWEGGILFWETSEEEPSPAEIDGILMDYDNMGVLDRLQGMLVGRPMGYDEAEKQALREVILERCRPYRFPIVTDMDFGHTAPQLTLPIGCRARIDGLHRRVEVLEPAVC